MLAAMLAAAGRDGAGPEQAVRAAVAATAATAMAAILAVTALLAVLLVVLLAVPLNSVRRETRMGRIVTSLPWLPLSAIYSLSAPRCTGFSDGFWPPATGSAEHQADWKPSRQPRGFRPRERITSHSFHSARYRGSQRQARVHFPPESG